MSKKSAVQDLQQQINELTEALLRERADAMNMRRRAEEEKMQAANFYKTMILRELLPAIDNLERAISHEPKVTSYEKKNLQPAASNSELQVWKDWSAGVKSVLKQLEQCFAQLGVKRIKTVGEHFDPHLHEAVHMDVSSEALAKGEDGGDGVEIISEELMPGYKLGDEVIRHAMVKVKKG